MTRASRAISRCLEFAALAACASILGAGGTARAQDSGPGLSPADSAAVAAAMAASDSAASEGARRLALADPDRFELGLATPRGYFDWMGTFGYRRRVLIDPRFVHMVQVEATGGHRDYLTEGGGSVYWFLRPRRVLHSTGRLRPILEGGVGLHLVVQFADIVGFDDWASHARLFGKSHGVAGVEFDMDNRWGLALRGRITVPSHRPLDYAQLVLFLR